MRYIALLLLIAVFVLSSCEKCFRCTIDGGSQMITEEGCDKGEDIKAFVQAYENAGYECVQFKD